MKFRDFLTGKCHDGAILKVIWPEKNKIATGYPSDFKEEMSMMNANVFDFMILQHSGKDYDVMVWLTKTDLTMI